MHPDPSNDLMFNEDEPGSSNGADAAESGNAPWKLLIVDDEPEVHAVTTLALQGFSYQGRSLQMLHAYSGRESIEIMGRESDVAIILMDVVMETDHAGLDAVQAIRNQLGNHLVRIILRTGQPGQAPEKEVVTRYDINDYKEKTELTSKKLFTMVYTVLGYYRQLRSAEAHREALQRLVDELKRSNRDLNDYAYIASHDLASPLRAISGFSSLLESRYAKDLPDEAREYLEFIRQSTRRMKQLMDDLLLLAQVGNRGRPTSVALEQSLSEALVSLTASIEASGAQIERTPLPTVLGFEAELRQLLQNLIGNAIKFRRSGVTPRIALSGKVLPDGWQIIVDDNGIGIPLDQRGRIFQLFKRLHSAEEYEGTGVGLALCRKVAEAHGGGIEVADSPLGGTRFVVNLRPPEQRASRGAP